MRPLQDDYGRDRDYGELLCPLSLAAANEEAGMEKWKEPGKDEPRQGTFLRIFNDNKEKELKAWAAFVATQRELEKSSEVSARAPYTAKSHIQTALDAAPFILSTETRESSSSSAKYATDEDFDDSESTVTDLTVMSPPRGRGAKKGGGPFGAHPAPNGGEEPLHSSNTQPTVPHNGVFAAKQDATDPKKDANSGRRRYRRNSSKAKSAKSDTKPVTAPQDQPPVPRIPLQRDTLQPAGEKAAPPQTPAPKTQAPKSAVALPLQPNKDKVNIKTKLSQHGVTVSDPVKTDNWDSTPPPAAKQNIRAPQMKDASQGIVAMGWAAVTPSAPKEDAWAPAPAVPAAPSTRQSATSNRGRGRGRGDRGRGAFNNATLGRGGPSNGFQNRVNNHDSARDTRWPPNKEMAADPKRWQTKWDMSSERSISIDTCWADGGNAEAMKKKRFVAEQNGAELSGWDGNWAPAPIDWDSRPAFRESQSTALIEKWLEVTHSALEGQNLGISIDKNDEECQVLVSHHWLPVTLGEKPVSQFWDKLVRSTSPEPADEGDLDGVKPWWETLQSTSPGCATLQPFVHPFDSFGIDPEETPRDTLARGRDKGSNKAAANRAKHEMEKKEKRRKRKQKEEAVQKAWEAAGRNLKDLGPTCDLKIYIRDARVEDLGTVCEIYNHYIEFSNCVSETTLLTVEEWKVRLTAAQESKLPFFIAAKRGELVRGGRKNKRQQDDILLPDKVIGFIFAKDHGGAGSIYEKTVEAQLYVDYQHSMKGVGRCLFDQLLGRLDLTWTPSRKFAEDQDDEDDFEPMPFPRTVRKIMVNVAYDKSPRIEWISRWLVDRFLFNKVGTMDDVGNKNNTSISVALFQRKVNYDQEPIPEDELRRMQEEDSDTSDSSF